MLNTNLAKRRRLELGLTQAQLGERVGVGITKAHIQSWEVGRYEPRSIDTLRRYARALEVNLDELVVADPDGEVANSP
jgi:transcriptional regulator with XRE-family HTH domain